MEDLQTLFNTAEQAIVQFNNDTSAVSNDQTKIAAAQAQLASDQATQTTDGATAYIAVGALITALQQVQGTLPAPVPAVQS